MVAVMTTTATTPRPDSDTESRKLHGRALGLIVVLCAAFFLDALDTSMMAVALPSIQHSLHMTTGGLQWIVSGYVLGYGGFLLLGGRSADILGRRKVFLVALVVFLVMSGIGGIATGGGLLIGSRFVKGIAAGFTAPAGLSIILSSFAEGPLRHKALAMYSATGAAGFSFGLIAGGLLSEITWRLVFFVPTIIAVVTLVAALRLIPADGKSKGSWRRLDVAGAATITASMLLLVFTLIEAPAAGWVTTRTLVSLVVVAALLTVFATIESRQASPLLDLRLLRSWPRVRANLGAMVFVGGWAATQFILTLYMQEVRGWSALTTAGAFWPLGVLGLFVAPKLTSLVGRFGLLRVLWFGLGLTVLAYGLILKIGTLSNYWAVLFPTFALIGIAFGLCFSTLNIAATEDVDPEQHGVASGLFQASTQFGTALLLAITTAVNQATTRPASTGGLLHGYHAALLVPLAASSGILILIGLGAVRRSASRNEAKDLTDIETAELAESLPAI
jgi:MFS family permease